MLPDFDFCSLVVFVLFGDSSTVLTLEIFETTVDDELVLLSVVSVFIGTESKYVMVQYITYILPYNYNR